MVIGVGEGVADGVLLGVTARAKGVGVTITPAGVGEDVGEVQAEKSNEKKVRSVKGEV
jgi:hypothetical protein